MLTVAAGLYFLAPRYLSLPIAAPPCKAKTPLRIDWKCPLFDSKPSFRLPVAYTYHRFPDNQKWRTRRWESGRGRNWKNPSKS
jgi:hypothetical protein